MFLLAFVVVSHVLLGGYWWVHEYTVENYVEIQTRIPFIDTLSSLQSCYKDSSPDACLPSYHSSLMDLSRITYDPTTCLQLSRCLDSAQFATDSQSQLLAVRSCFDSATLLDRDVRYMDSGNFVLRLLLVLAELYLFCYGLEGLLGHMERLKPETVNLAKEELLRQEAKRRRCEKQEYTRELLIRREQARWVREAERKYKEKKVERVKKSEKAEKVPKTISTIPPLKVEKTRKKVKEEIPKEKAVMSPRIPTSSSIFTSPFRIESETTSVVSDHVFESALEQQLKTTVSSLGILTYDEDFEPKAAMGERQGSVFAAFSSIWAPDQPGSPLKRQPVKDPATISQQIKESFRKKILAQAKSK